MDYNKKTWGTYEVDDSKTRAENVAAADKKNALIKKADLDRWETAHDTAAKEINGLTPVNNLTSTDATKPLAAPQGKVLSDKITEMKSVSVTSTTWTPDSLNVPVGTTVMIQMAPVLMNAITESAMQGVGIVGRTNGTTYNMLIAQATSSGGTFALYSIFYNGEYKFKKLL